VGGVFEMETAVDAVERVVDGLVGVFAGLEVIFDGVWCDKSGHADAAVLAVYPADEGGGLVEKVRIARSLGFTVVMDWLCRLWRLGYWSFRFFSRWV
jgi:hypothetical protein